MNSEFETIFARLRGILEEHSAKYAKGKGVDWTRTFTRREYPSSPPIRSAFAWFAYFAVPSGFSRMNGSLPCRPSGDQRTSGDVPMRFAQRRSPFPSPRPAPWHVFTV